MAGLAESVSGIWSGDEDLNDGKVQKEYEDYISRLNMIKNLKLHDENLPVKLGSVLTGIKDLEFLHRGKTLLHSYVLDCIQYCHKLLTALQKSQSDYEKI